MRTLVCLALLLTAGSRQLSAQAVTGTIYGFVTDPTQAVIAGAKVAVVNTNTNYGREMLTQNDGSYRFPSLPLGEYRLVTEQSGFNTVMQEGIVLQVDQQVRIDVMLRVGNVAEKLEVTAEAPLINATNAETSEVIDRRRVEMLPLNGRNFVQLLQHYTGRNGRYPEQSGDQPVSRLYRVHRQRNADAV